MARMRLRRRTTILTRMASRRLMIIIDDLTTLINRRRPMRVRTRLLSRSPRALLLLLLWDNRLLSRVLLCSSLCSDAMRRLDTLQSPGARNSSRGIAGLDIRGWLLARSDDRSLRRRGRATLGAGCRGRTDAIERALCGLETGRGTGYRRRALALRGRVVLLTVIILACVCWWLWWAGWLLLTGRGSGVRSRG